MVLMSVPLRFISATAPLVHFAPSYKGNPYQQMLYAALGDIGAKAVPVKEITEPDIAVVNNFFSAAAFASAAEGAKARVVTTIAMFYDLDRPAEFVADVAGILDEDRDHDLVADRDRNDRDRATSIERGAEETELELGLDLVGPAPRRAREEHRLLRGHRLVRRDDVRPGGRESRREPDPCVGGRRAEEEFPRPAL